MTQNQHNQSTGIMLSNLKNFERVSEFETEGDEAQLPRETRRTKTLKANRDESLSKSKGIRQSKLHMKPIFSQPLSNLPKNSAVILLNEIKSN